MAIKLEVTCEESVSLLQSLDLPPTLNRTKGSFASGLLSQYLTTAQPSYNYLFAATTNTVSYGYNGQVNPLAAEQACSAAHVAAT